MSSVINTVVWVFAGIGLVSITGVILYYIAKALKSYKPPEQPIWPDASYMDKLGAQCPSGWLYRGENANGQNICQNYYNVPVEDVSKCYDLNTNKQRISYFDKINDWYKCQDDPGKCRPLRKRCSWIKNCGPPLEKIDFTKCNNGMLIPNSGKDVISRPYASWIGVSNKC